jgi:hypothetical protein
MIRDASEARANWQMGSANRGGSQR